MVCWVCLCFEVAVMLVCPASVLPLAKGLGVHSGYTQWWPYGPGCASQVISPMFTLFFSSFIEILLTYNIYKFKVSNVMIWYMCILQSDCHSWIWVTLKPSSSAKFMINNCIQKSYSLSGSEPVPLKIEEYKRKGGLKPYTSPSVPVFWSKIFGFSLPGLPRVSKAWLKS